MHLGSRLLGNLLTGKGAIAMSQGQGTIRAGKGTLEQVKVQLGQVTTFNTVSSFN